MDNLPGTLTMLERQHARMDVESLQNNARPRCSCLDVFLVISIIFLFVAVGAIAAGGLLVVKDLRSKVEVLKPSFEQDAPARQIVESLAPAYKMQNFAYLQPILSNLRNGTMKWAPVHHGAGTSIGSYFSFNKIQHTLQPTKEGSYFMYLELKLTCTFRCNAGLLTVRLGDQLTCHFEVPEGTKNPVTRKCWTVAMMDGKKQLVAQMIVPEEGLNYWSMDLNDSKLGMFLVD